MTDNLILNIAIAARKISHDRITVLFDAEYRTKFMHDKLSKLDMSSKYYNKLARTISEQDKYMSYRREWMTSDECHLADILSNLDLNTMSMRRDSIVRAIHHFKI